MNGKYSLSIFFFIILLISCNSPQRKQVNKKAPLSKNQKSINNFSDAKYLYTHFYTNDSIKSKSLLYLVKFSYKQKQWDTFNHYRLEHINTPALNQFKKHRAKIFYFSGSFFYYQQQQDSAYYYYNKGFKHYKQLNDSLKVGKILLNMAIIQKNGMDYTGSESTCFKALAYLNKERHKRYVASLYNNLGIIYNGLGDFENTVKYHTKAYTLRKELKKKKYLLLHSLNNLGNAFKENKAYQKAIYYYKEALAYDTILAKHPKIYAMLIDNYAHAQFLNNTLNKPTLFFKSLQIRDSINDVPGIIVSYLRLANYYKSKGNNSIAKKHCYRAKALSKAIHYNTDYLESLTLLMKLSPDNEALLFAKEYILLKDSLQKKETIIKEQFSRVKYETEEKEKENLQLKTDKAQQKLIFEKENKRKWYFASGLIAALLTLVIFAYFYQQNKKQKEVIVSLQKDLHHRVKNNLAIIDALIDDIKDEFNTAAFVTKLTDLQNRIDSINEVHSQLYQNTDITNLKLKKYIKKLVKNIQHSFAKENITIQLAIEEHLQLHVEKSFPVGLIVNEFLSNSFKYAFDTNKKGIITINIVEKAKSYILTLSDNGKGLPQGFNSSDLDSFGIDVMKLLSRQLKGTFVLDGTDGVKLTITFPKK